MAVTWKKLAIEDEVILNSVLDANSILYAVTDNTPAALAVSASTIVGRKATGDVVALTGSEGRTVLGLAETDTPTFTSVLLYDTVGGQARQFIASFRNDVNGSLLQMGSARGSYASPAVSQQNDRVGWFGAYGYSAAASTFRNCAAVAFYIDGEPDTAGDTSDMPGRIAFQTVANGTVALTDRLTIYSTGLVTANYGLVVNELGGSAATDDLRAESDTEANMLWLDASADLLYLGGSTAGVSIAKGGDTTFLGDGSGLPYGSCYGNEIGWSQASAAQNTWYEVSDADMADGELNAITHDGSGKLTVTVAGRYLINYTCSAEVSLPNKHVQSAISISGTESNAGTSHFEAATAGAQFNVAGTAIIDLAANATIEVSLRTTDTGAPDISVDHLNITVVMVGGT